MATLADLRYVPAFRVTINDAPIPAALRASISSVSYDTGLEGADRVEVTLVNENLRWLDNPLFRLDNALTLALGYAPAPLERVFVGEIVGQNATFPGGGIPTLTIVAQDRRHRLQRGTKTRWFAVPTPFSGKLPLPDPTVAGIVAIENALFPITEPIGAALAVLVGGIEVFLAWGEPDTMQKLIRKQAGKSDFEFLQYIAQENGWEMLIDHDGPLGGHKLRFMSPLAHLSSDVTLTYGRSLIDFTPRISDVGQFVGVTVRLWQPNLKMEFTVTVSWDYDRNSLDVSISPGFGGRGALGLTPQEFDEKIQQALARGNPEAAQELQKTKDELDKTTLTLVDEPVTLASAGRVILSKLIPSLNKRLTGSGNTIGDPRIKAGSVLRLEGLGEQFGGLYRVTSAKHTIDGGGYHTSFNVRKEVWFGSIPLVEQGAVQARVLGERIGQLGL
jgi:phage protein D